jgi:hypothetical protein
MRVLQLALAVSAIALAACVHVKIEETREVASSISAGEGVALVARQQTEGVSSESEFLDCLERQMMGREIPASTTGDGAQPANSALVNNGVRLVPHKAFVDQLYPWLEPSTTLVDDDFAATLLARKGVRERIADSGVRYLITIDGLTNVVDKSGSISCAIGPGGGGCIGVAFWRKNSGYQANIWDLKRGVSLGTVGTDATGNSVFIGALVPLPFIAPVQRTACNRMANELQRFLKGEGE